MPSDTYINLDKTKLKTGLELACLTLTRRLVQTDFRLDSRLDPKPILDLDLPRLDLA